MAIPFIDRDPKQMIRYGKEAKEIVDQMNNSLRILEIRQINHSYERYFFLISFETTENFVKLHVACA